jgi:hypothetical protein
LGFESLGIGRAVYYLLRVSGPQHFAHYNPITFL